jgi:hypothetical protein
LTEEQAPIISTGLTDINKKYVSNPDKPDYVFSKAKVIFCQSFYVTKGYHNQNARTKGLRVVMDEFRFEAVLVPTIYTQMLLAAEGEQSVRKFIMSKYGKEDYDILLTQLQNRLRGDTKNEKAFVANWIKNTEKLTFLTSEKLACKILESIGFTIFNINPNEDLSSKYFEVATTKINREWFNNIVETKGWDYLKANYEFVIADKLKSSNCFSHAAACGRNKMNNGKPILVVLSHVPKSTITLIQNTLNDIAGVNINYEEIASLFYRDKLCQATGRSVGFRGSGPCYVVCNETIWEKYLKPNYDNLDIPISYKLWDDESDIALNLIQQAKTQKVMLENVLNDVINNHFEYHEGSYLLFTDIKEYVKANNLKRPTGAFIKTPEIAKVLNVKVGKKRLGGKVLACLKNVRIKNA